MFNRFDLALVILQLGFFLCMILMLFAGIRILLNVIGLILKRPICKVERQDLVDWPLILSLMHPWKAIAFYLVVIFMIHEVAGLNLRFMCLSDLKDSKDYMFFSSEVYEDRRQACNAIIDDNIFNYLVVLFVLD